jgi:hypothetical protein
MSFLFTAFAVLVLVPLLRQLSTRQSEKKKTGCSVVRTRLSTFFLRQPLWHLYEMMSLNQLRQKRQYSENNITIQMTSKKVRLQQASSMSKT